MNWEGSELKLKKLTTVSEGLRDEVTSMILFKYKNF